MKYPDLYFMEKNFVIFYQLSLENVIFITNNDILFRQSVLFLYGESL